MPNSQPPSLLTDPKTVHATLHTLLPQLREQYGVQALWLFGSRRRGTARPDSDLDILVEFDNRSLSLFKFIELENHLSDALSMRVDLVEKQTLKPAIGRHILEEAMPI
jgi:uncharacterized protein